MYVNWLRKTKPTLLKTHRVMRRRNACTKLYRRRKPTFVANVVLCSRTSSNPTFIGVIMRSYGSNIVSIATALLIGHFTIMWFKLFDDHAELNATAGTKTGVYAESGPKHLFMPSVHAEFKRSNFESWNCVYLDFANLELNITEHLTKETVLDKTRIMGSL